MKYFIQYIVLKTHTFHISHELADYCIAGNGFFFKTYSVAELSEKKLSDKEGQEKKSEARFSL